MAHPAPLAAGLTALDNAVTSRIARENAYILAIKGQLSQLFNGLQNCVNVAAAAGVAVPAGLINDLDGIRQRLDTTAPFQLGQNMATGQSFTTERVNDVMTPANAWSLANARKRNVGPGGPAIAPLALGGGWTPNKTRRKRKKNKQ
jgi:hypothetical protein